jgi:predicted ATP-grasp superfamily ATP-dependent carboligase
MTRNDRKIPTILLIGASCRAAAWSAFRAGFRVISLDLFADRDTKLYGECFQINEYPKSIPDQVTSIAAKRSFSTIVLSGGMENHPSLVEELETRYSILGPNARQIRVLRDPINWQRWCPPRIRGDTVGESHIRFPERIVDERELLNTPKSGGWIRKPYRSSGGVGVELYSTNHNIDFSSEYLQAFIEGLVLGVVFLCRNASVEVVGATLSIYSNAPLSFQYEGSVGPVALDPNQLSILISWMKPIAIEANYEGLIQADFVVDPDGEIYLLEINPRWTAGMEVVELSTNRRLMLEHWAASRAKIDQSSWFETGHTARANSEQRPGTEFKVAYRYEKSISYRKQTTTILQPESDGMMTELFHDESGESSVEKLGWADVPEPGTTIEAGTPFATQIRRCLVVDESLQLQSKNPSTST